MIDKKETLLEDQDVLVNPVITRNQLALQVENLVLKDHLTYLEAIIQICDDLDTRGLSWERRKGRGCGQEYTGFHCSLDKPVA